MRSLLIILVACSAYATTTITVDGTTATQSVSRTVTDQNGFCTYRVSEGSAFVANINDVNTALFTGADKDSRAGSIITGKTHIFVAGTRTSNKAADNKMYSRALQNNTLHWIGVACGNDAEVSTTFRTVNPPLGNTYAESFPYDANGLGGYAWPTVDFEDLTKVYIEPTTGTALRLLSTGGYNSPSAYVSAGVSQRSYEPSASAWTTPANGAVIDAAFAVNSTTADPLFIRFNPFCGSIASGGCEYSWQVGLDATTVGIDDVRVNLTCNGNGSTVAAEVALTSDGVNPVTGWNAVTCPASNGIVSFPASGYPHHSLQGWIANAAAPATALQNFATPIAAQFDGTVTASGTAVTVTLSHSATIPLTWVAGSRVNIAGTNPICTANECTIASITDASHFVVTQNLGTYNGAGTALNGAILGGATSFVATDGSVFIQVAQNLNGAVNMQWTGLIETERFYCTTRVTNTFSGCINGNNFGPLSAHSNGVTVSSFDFQAQNFGVLVRRPATGTLRVDGVGFEVTTSYDFKMPADGIYDLCSKRANAIVTDSGGVSGYLCDINTGLFGTLWFIPTDPFLNQPRYLGQLHFNAIGTGVDTTNAIDCRLDSSEYDPTDPNSFYCSTTFANNSRLAIIKATYNSAGGVGGCAVTADYQALPFNGTNWPYNCNITLTNTGLQSTSRDPVSQALAFDPEFTTAFGGGSLSGGQNGKLLINWTPQQQAMGWFGWIDPAASYNLIALTNTYSKSVAGQRYCGNHNITPLGTSDTVYWVAIPLQTSSGVTGFGPYLANVTTTIPASAGVTCTGITNAYALSQIAAGQGCVTIQIDRATPCRTSPSAYELANYTDCAANPGAGQRQLPVAGAPFQEGDFIRDINGPTEFLMLAKSLGGNSWTAIRNVLPFQGPFLTNRDVYSGIQAHAANWTVEAYCNSTSFTSGAGMFKQTDPHGVNQQVDWMMTPTGHLDIQNDVVAVAGIAYRTGFPATLGQAVNALSGSAQIGGTVLSNGSFSGNRGNGEYNNYDGGAGSNNAVGSHPSLSRDPINSRYYLDGNAYENGNTGAYNIWNQAGVTNVSGTLYKIPKASVVYQTNYPASLKTHDFSVFAGKYLLKNISGPSSVIDGTSTHWYHHCEANIANECVAGSVQGDVYANVPQMAGSLPAYDCASVLFNLNTLCATPLGPENGYVNQFAFPTNKTGIFGGATMRHLTSGFGRYGSQYVFNNARGSANGKFFITDTPWLDGYRTVMWIGKLPPLPVNESTARNVHVSLPVTLGSSTSPKARARFGYAEAGPAASLYCSDNRLETCSTNPSASVAIPYFWASDSSQTYTTCSAGCTINIPTIPGRVIYFVIDRLDNSGNITATSELRAVAIP